jgi:hypothetical protein
MFVQVIQGNVSDGGDGARAALDRWVADLAPWATGWLGSTSGVTDDGRFVALARFASEEEARANSERPAQGEWWADLTSHLDGEPTVHDSTYVEVATHGDPADSGFVQVMQGRTSDLERSRELMASNPVDWESYRPDVLGTVNVGHEGGAWTMAIYFTSEAAAREGEAKPPTPEMAAMMEELNALSVGEPTFYDLRDPWLVGP